MSDCLKDDTTSALFVECFGSQICKKHVPTSLVKNPRQQNSLGIIFSNTVKFVKRYYVIYST